MNQKNVLLTYVNLGFLALLIYLIARFGLAPAPEGWDWKDLITIILVAIGVLLAAVTVFLGLLAVLGYAAIRDAAIDAATKEAVPAAERAAREVAEPVAIRTVQDALAAAGITAGDAGTDAIKDALAKKEGGS